MYGQLVSKIPSSPNTNFLLPVHTAFTSSLCFHGASSKFKKFLVFVPPYVWSSGVKKIPSHPNTNFLLPVHAVFTFGLCFWGLPAIFKTFFLYELLIEG